jgi:hypothetical protein
MTEPGDLCPYVRSHSIDQHVFGGLVLLAVDIMTNKDESGVDDRLNELMDTAAMIKRKQRAFNPSNTSVIFAIDKLVEVLQTRDQHQTLVARDQDERVRESNLGLQAVSNVCHGVDTRTDFLQDFIDHDMDGLWEELLNGSVDGDVFNAP